ncbi:DUF1127 domain-containing protein [Sedimenticola sp.]|uniref:DUF1127 domain-containing protein n=1 Tax=Sedimenticola sp. TaxID=1940285 RepID=UPI003D1441A3
MKQFISDHPSFFTPASPCVTLERQCKWTLVGLLRKLADSLHRWRMLSRERYLLMTLSDATLKDIGISRLDAESEARRPFWDDQGIRR